MSSARRKRVLERLAFHVAAPSRPIGDALCATAVDVLELPGVGISLQHLGGDHHSIGTSSRDMEVLHELERTLNEGPCVDAFTLGEPTAEPDLTNPTAGRWVAFNAAALQTEARAAFGYPLHINGACLGALNLYATRPGPLTKDQHADALVMADVATHAALTIATPSRAGLLDDLLDAGENQLTIDQATGMVTVQLSVGIADALARLRAHAYAEDRTLSAVAADVVARRLRFDP